MKTKISLIGLGVRDFAEALRFYRDGLGFPTYNYAEGEDHVMFQLAGSWLSLYPRDKLAEDAAVPDDGSGFSGITHAHNVSSRDQVEIVFSQAVAAGAKPRKPPQDVFGAGITPSSLIQTAIYGRSLSIPLPTAPEIQIRPKLSFSDGYDFAAIPPAVRSAPLLRRSHHGTRRPLAEADLRAACQPYLFA